MYDLIMAQLMYKIYCISPYFFLEAETALLKCLYELQ